MKRFVFHKEQEYRTIIKMWQALGFHFAIKKDPNSRTGIIVYLLDSSGN